MSQEVLQQPGKVYRIEASSCSGFHVRRDGKLARDRSRPVIFGTIREVLDHIWHEALSEGLEPEVEIDLNTLDIHPSLRHPTDPTLFKVTESIPEYVTIDYIVRRCTVVECTYKLWQGSRKSGEYVLAPPVIYRNVTRDEAYTMLVYALNTGDASVNQWRQAYSDIRTREVEGAS